MAIAPDKLQWPFLAIMMSSSPSGEPPRVLGLGFTYGGAIVTLAHIAERAEFAVLSEGGPDRPVAVMTVEGGIAVMSQSPPPRRTAALGGGKGPVEIAVVSDISPSTRLLTGHVDHPDGAERFTVALDERLGEDWTASGSPVVAGDTVIGIVGPTASSGSVDAFGAVVIERLFSAPQEFSPPPELSAATQGALDEAAEIVSDVGPAAAVLLSVLHSGAGDTAKTVPAQLFARVGTQRLVAAYQRFTGRPIPQDPRSREE